MKEQKIAVIGISGRFAGAKSIEDFRQMLSKKKISVSELSSKRRELMGIEDDKEYMSCGYLEDVDAFEPEFFGITKREARLMSPEQRISMELVAETILDAGYSLQDFRGKKCGVFVAGGASDYNKFVKKQSSTSIIGSEPYMLSGRIGYQFDLRGENFTVNSGCSSSMVALNIAREKLMLGRIDTAIVGGVITYVEPMEKNNNMYDILGIMSEDYTLNPFDVNADGTALGEGGGYVMLKRLEDAQRDRDYIYGVILECVVNSDGGRCDSVSMPSMDAQRDVIDFAWNGIDVNALTEIEAHGIGAAIGDAVESDGIIQAMKKHNIVGKDIALSTVKSNIGHLVTCSGMSSLIKVMMGYKYKETYPIAGLNKVSNLIHTRENGIVFQNDVKKWNDDEKRMTGINSFGLSGCNAHMVVENYLNEKKDNDSTPKMIKISAKTKESFDQMKNNIVYYLNHEEKKNLSSVEFTLNAGRDDYDFRGIAYGTDENEVVQSLSNVQAQNQNVEWKVIFAAKSDEIQSIDYDQLLNAFPSMQQWRRDNLSAMVYEWLLKIGIKCQVVLMDKLYRATFDFWSGKMEEAEYRTFYDSFEYNNEISNYRTVIDQKIASGEPVIIVDFTKDSLFESYQENENVEVVNVTTCEGIQRLIGLWYSSGNIIDWNAIYQGETRTRIPAPTYAFNRKSYWIDMTKQKETTTEQGNAYKYEKSKFLEKVSAKKVFYMNNNETKKVNLHEFPYCNIAFKNQYVPITGDIASDYQIAMYRVLEKAGIVPDVILGTENAITLYKWIRGWCEEAELFDSLSRSSGKASREEEIVDKIKKLAQDSLVVVFNMEKESTLRNLDLYNVIVLDLSKEEDFRVAMEFSEDMEDYAHDSNVNEKKQEIENEEEKIVKTPEQIELEEYIEKIWSDALGLSSGIQHDESFFALGGNSLIMQSMSEKINTYIEREYDIFEIYDYDTIEKLAENILAS